MQLHLAATAGQGQAPTKSGKLVSLIMHQNVKESNLTFSFKQLKETRK